MPQEQKEIKVAEPKDQILLINSLGEPIDIEELIKNMPKKEDRVLADDEVGTVIYVGDLDIFKLTPTATGEFMAKKVTQISRPRFSTPMIRRQIGATVLSITEDAIFLVKSEDCLIKVRAKDLEVGMILVNGDKVLR